MTTSVSIDYDLEEIKAASTAAALEVVNEAAEEAGRFMARRATELMGQAWNLGRSYDRRRYPGSARAADSISYYTRVSISDDSVEIGYDITGDGEVFLRIMGLNYGTGSADISPSGAWELRQTPGIPKTLYWPERNFPKEVFHGGNDGAFFLEDAMDEAVEKFKSLL